MAKIQIRPVVRSELQFRIRGTSQLITHAWSEKAKRMMREKQAGKKTKTREIRDPDAETDAALYKTADGKDGPVFSLITAFQAVLKRAELSQQFDGIEGGVIVRGKDGLHERPGELLLDGESLVGAWARCYRKDQRVPHYVSVNRRMYDKGRSLWKEDPAAMLVKCAKAKAMREAFPSELGGLVVEGEFSATVAAKEDRPKIASAFAEPTPQPTEELVLDSQPCGTCGKPVPLDLLDGGDCPDCFSAKERA